MLMRHLYMRLRDFWKAAAAFFAAVEIPVILLFAFICLPAASAALDLFGLAIQPTHPLSLIEAAAAWLGLFHAYAAMTNLLIEAFERRSKKALKWTVKQFFP